MIKNPSARQLEAFASLENDYSFRLILDWLRESSDATVEACISETDMVRVRRAQGAAADLQEILKLAGTARQILDKKR